ncbi:MAG: aminopeptidase P family protein [Acidobacteria bacterium]|nr:MAG: aminopeptidase P family protein [Acidobacteriota bacterium]
MARPRPGAPNRVDVRICSGLTHSLTTATYDARLARLRGRLAAPGAQALIVTNLNNIRYLTGFAGSAGALVLSLDRCVLLVDGRYEEVVRAGQTAGAIAPVDVARVRKYDTAIVDHVVAGGWTVVGFEADHTPVSQFRRWSEGLGSVELRPTSDLVESARVVKDPTEIRILRDAASRLSDVARRIGEWVAVDRTELEIAGDVDRALRQAGFEKPAFDTIVASGPNTAYPHARPTDRRVRKGDLVLLDFGGVLEGYCVDLTRMAGAGRVGAEALSLFRAVREAQEAAIAAVAPGAMTTEVDAAARQVLAHQQLGSAFVHGTGHGLGLDVHEAPRVGPGDPSEAVRLESGMVVTIEPGAYVVGLGGVRLEDDVLVTTEGREVLTTAPRDLLIV